MSSGASVARDAGDAATYGGLPRTVAELLHLGKRVRSTLDLHRAIRAGLPTSSLEHLAHALAVTLDSVLPMVSLPARTHARRRASGALSVAESERVVRVARVYARASMVLGAVEKARRWLQAPNRGLGNAIPLELLDTDVGASAVEDVLGRIEYGVIG